MELVARSGRPAGGGAARRDWVFLAFLCFALGMSCYTWVQRTRIARALTLTDLCLARADAACATKSLEQARELGATGARVNIEQADLHSLLDERNDAIRALAPFATSTGVEALDLPTRGVLLLVQGDVEAARGRSKAAHELYDSARPLVRNPELVDARTTRLDERLRDEATSFARIKDELEHLLVQASVGAVATVSIGVTDLTARVGKLPDAVSRGKLTLALAAVDRAVQAAGEAKRSPAAGASEAFGSPPPPPTRDDVPATGDAALAEKAFQQRLKAYKGQLADFEQARAEHDRLAQGRRASSDDIASGELEAARRLLAEATVAFEKRGEP